MRQIEEHGAPKNCRCESCKRAKGQPHKIAFGTVREYRAEPRGGWKEKRMPGESEDATVLGVELETMAPPRVPDYQYRCRKHRWRYGTQEYGDFEVATTNRTGWVAPVPRSRMATDERDRRVRDPDAPTSDFADRYRAHLASCTAPAMPRRDAPPRVSNGEAADMRRPKYHWVPKHDGSVTGPEFASQPASLKWWYAHRAQLDEMFTMLLHAGYRSHEGDTAGLHVNINTAAFGSNVMTVPGDRTAELAAADGLADELAIAREAARTAYRLALLGDDVAVRDRATEAFSNARSAACHAADRANELRRSLNERPTRVGAEDHLRRFLDLIYVNKQWSRRMAQRTAESEQHWAKLDVLDNPAQRAEWVTAAVKRGRNINDRYLAVNRPDGIRYEFRLPRGTLRLDRFYKNLEWTHAMIEYTRNLTGAIECTPVKFMAWVLKGSDYPYLRAFITEKFTAQVERTPILKGAVA